MGFWSSVAGAIGSALSCVANLAVSVIRVVAAPIAAICKALGLMKQEEKVEDLGDKTIQAEEAGIKPEKYQDFKDYVKAVENFQVDPEKSKKISLDDKLRRGSQTAAGMLQAEFPNAPIEKLIELSATNTGMVSEKRFAELGKLMAENPKNLDALVNYLDGSDKSGEGMYKAIGILSAMEKAENPKLSDMEAAEKALNMR